MALPTRQTARLRFGRMSIPAATYFVTCCTKDRAPVLLEQTTTIAARTALRAMHATGDIVVLAATLMPDHIHLLFTLGARLQVGQIMAKFKTQTRGRGKECWRWQNDGFEDRLRSAEKLEDYGLYIFLNPYRAGLCPLHEPWPHWLCPESSVFRFLAACQASPTVPSEWLGLRDRIAARICAGR